MGIVDRVLGRFGYSKKGIGPLIDDSRIYRSLRSLLASTDSLEVEEPYQKSVWVFASINAIAQNISRVPFYIYTEKSKDIKKIIQTGPLYDLFTNPNPFMISSTLFFATIVYMELYGECFWILEGRSNITEVPTEIWCVTPTRFEPIINEKNGSFSGYWKYEINDFKTTFAPHQILHFKYFNPYNDIRGLSPIEASKNGVEQDFFANKYNKQFFKDGAALSGIIKAPDFLTDDQFNRLKNQFEERHSGYSNAHKIGVIEGGADFVETKAMSQKDMEFSVLKNVIRGEILAAFKTNEVVLGNYSEIQCFHPDTELMTDKGFVNVIDIKVGDLVASYNPDTEGIEFKPATKIYIYDHNGDMYTQRKPIRDGKETASKIDYFVTPEHKMFGKKADVKHYGTDVFQSDYEFKRISEVEEGRFVSPRNGKWNGKIVDTYSIKKKEYNNGNKLSAQGRKDTTFPIVPWLKFLGWFISEGCYRGENSHFSLGIAQLNEEGKQKIREDLKDFPYKVYEYESEDHGSTFVTQGKDLYNYLLENVGHYCQDKRIPRDILELHPDLLKHLFYALMDGDGTEVEEDRFVFYTTSKQLAFDVYELALRIGKIPALRGGEEGQVRANEKYPNKRNMWQVYIADEEMSKRMVSILPEKKHYEGKVYCVEVPPYHTVLMRYNGKSLIVSNSYEGISQAHSSFWKETLLPKMIYLEEFLWSKFFANIQGGKYWGGFDTSVIEALREDFGSKVEMAKTLVEIGYPINAINKRLDLGFEDFPWGDTWWVKIGMVPVDSILSGEVQPTNPNEQPNEEPEDEPEDEPEETPPEDEPVEPDEGKNIDLAKRDDALWSAFIARQVPVEDIFKNKIKRFLFEQRKRVLNSIYQDNYEFNFDTEVKLFSNVLIPLYDIAKNTGIDLIKEEVSLDFNSEDKELEQLITERMEFSSTTIIKTIFKQLETIIGEPDLEIKAEKIKKLYNRTNNRVETIARTESCAIINGIRYILMKNIGISHHKWICKSEKGRHDKYNGKVVKIGESFNKNYILRYPNDRKAPANEVIGCRCLTIPIVKIG